MARHLGVNLPGWLVAGRPEGHYRSFISEGDLTRLVNWRFTHVRLPLEAALLDDAGGWQVLDHALAACRQARLMVVLALEWPDHASLTATPGGWEPLAARWREIARRYSAAGPELVFDLLDRPALADDVSAETLAGLGAVRLSAAAQQRAQAPGATAGRAWNALAIKLTAAVREAEGNGAGGADRVGGPGGASGANRRAVVVQALEGTPERFNALRPTRDPETVYGFRCFLPAALTQRGEGTYPGTFDGERWDRERLRQAISPALEFRKTYDVPVYVTAFGVTLAAARQSRLTWMRSFLSLCRSEGLGWAYWAYSDPQFSLAPADVSASVDYDVLGVLQSE